MFNSAKNFIVSLMIGVLIITGAGCSKSSQSSKDVQAKQTDSKPNDEGKDFPGRFKSDDPNSVPADKQDKSFMGGKTLTIQDEASLLAGVWRMSYQGPACMAQAEMIFQPNGSYSGFSQCQNGSYAFRTVGTWRILQSGAVRVQYTDYEPKVFQGNKIRIPDGETMYYRFLDRNRIGFGGGIIAYRVQ